MRGGLSLTDRSVHQLPPTILESFRDVILTAPQATRRTIANGMGIAAGGLSAEDAVLAATKLPCVTAGYITFILRMCDIVAESDKLNRMCTAYDTSHQNRPPLEGPSNYAQRFIHYADLASYTGPSVIPDGSRHTRLADLPAAIVQDVFGIISGHDAAVRSLGAMTGVDASKLLSQKTSGDFRAIVTAAFAGTQATVAHLIVALRVGGAMDTAARLSYVYPAW
jgi:hypothetical protein